MPSVALVIASISLWRNETPLVFLARSEQLSILFKRPASVAMRYRRSSAVVCTGYTKSTIVARSSFDRQRCGTRTSTVSPSLKSKSSSAVCLSIRCWLRCTARALSSAARCCRASYALVSCSALLFKPSSCSCCSYCCCCCKHEAPKLASKPLQYSSSCSTSSVRRESALAKRLSRPSRWNIGDSDLCVCTVVLCMYAMLGSSSAQLKASSPWKLLRWCKYE